MISSNKVTSFDPGAAETEFSLARFHGDAENLKRLRAIKRRRQCRHCYVHSDTSGACCVEWYCCEVCSAGEYAEFFLRSNYFKNSFFDNTKLSEKILTKQILFMDSWFK